MKKLKVAYLSDTHDKHNDVEIPECDMIIHGGDFTNFGRLTEVSSFIYWYENLNIKHKVLVCGNHEVMISKQFHVLQQMCQSKNIRLLDNSAVEIEGLKIWGSPYSVLFGDWVFMDTDDKLAAIWKQIPGDADLVITHTPAFGVLVYSLMGHNNCGSASLLTELERIKPLLHMCGHIHESRGLQVISGTPTISANGAVVSANARAVEYKPYLFEISIDDAGKKTIEVLQPEGLNRLLKHEQEASVLGAKK